MWCWCWQISYDMQVLVWCLYLQIGCDTEVLVWCCVDRQVEEGSNTDWCGVVLTDW